MRGAEANNSRPAVIVSNDGANSTATRLGRGVLTVVPVTSDVDRVYPFQVPLPAESIGLPVDAKAQAEQVRSIDVVCVQRRLGSGPAVLMHKLDETSLRWPGCPRRDRLDSRTRSMPARKSMHRSEVERSSRRGPAATRRIAASSHALDKCPAHVRPTQWSHGSRSELSTRSRSAGQSGSPGLANTSATASQETQVDRAEGRGGTP